MSSLILLRISRNSNVFCLQNFYKITYCGQLRRFVAAPYLIYRRSDRARLARQAHANPHQETCRPTRRRVAEANPPQTRLSRSWQTQIRTSDPSARHALVSRSEIPRLLAATECRWTMPNSFQRQTRDGGFLNSVPIPGPFRVPSEAPRKGTKHQFPLGVAHGALVETRGRDPERQNGSIKQL